MQNKTKNLLLLTASTIPVLIFIRRKKMQQNNEIKEKPKMTKVKMRTAAQTERAKPMNNVEKKQFVDYVRALSADELEIVAKEIPIEYCLNRVIDEIIEAEALRAGVNALVKLNNQGER